MTFRSPPHPCTTVQPLITVIKPFQVTRKQLNQMFNSPTQVKQMITSGWIIPVRPGKPGRETLFSYESAERATMRLQAGEEPPPMAKTMNLQLQETK